MLILMACVFSPRQNRAATKNLPNRAVYCRPLLSVLTFPYTKDKYLTLTFSSSQWMMQGKRI